MLLVFSHFYVVLGGQQLICMTLNFGVLSNILFLIAFFTFLLLPDQWLAIGAGLFILVWAIERFSTLIPKTSDTYSQLRMILTIVASLSMITTYLSGVG
jgi:hypothetical protein